MTTQTEIEAAVKAIKDLKLGTKFGSLQLDTPILRLIAMAVLDAAENVRAVAKTE